LLKGSGPTSASKTRKQKDRMMSAEPQGGPQRAARGAAAFLAKEATPDTPDPVTSLQANPHKGNRGLARMWRALGISIAGLTTAVKEESAFRQELLLAAVLLPVAAFAPVEPVSRALMMATVLLVLLVELLNSSVEAAIDRISLERHELSRRAKDFGRAAVLIAIAICAMTWLVILFPWLSGRLATVMAAA
jgi:diacylglycerol kinase (ATP)